MAPKLAEGGVFARREGHGSVNLPYPESSGFETIPVQGSSSYPSPRVLTPMTFSIDRTSFSMAKGLRM